MTDDTHEITEVEARSIMRVLGKVEGEFAVSTAFPIFWTIREAHQQYRARNGTGFALDTGERMFGVTANHVLEGWRADRSTRHVGPLQIGDLSFDPDGRNAIIAAHPGIDIATFQISPDQVRQLGKTVIRGYQRGWPPIAPQQDRGIYHAGFPGKERIWVSPRAISFGASYGGGVASGVSELDVSSLIERDQIMPVEGLTLPPENYDFRGISGGPMLSVIEHQGLRTWALAGVIYQGPNTSDDPSESIPGLEIIKARRAHFILPDGRLDKERWDSVQPW